MSESFRAKEANLDDEKKQIYLCITSITGCAK